MHLRRCVGRDQSITHRGIEDRPSRREPRPYAELLSAIAGAPLISIDALLADELDELDS
jgi:hypothetical protein